MKAGEICQRETVVVDGSESIEEAARLMRKFHVGTLVVVNGARHPSGILTDRDIVVGGVALGPERTATLRVSDLVTGKIVTANQDEDIFFVLKKMRAHGIRRIPVVDEKGDLEGIFSLDDALKFLAEEMSEVSNLISQEQSIEKSVRR